MIITENTSIKEVLGNDWKNAKLYDDGSQYGGISYNDERLENFMNEIGMSENESYFKLLFALKDNGIVIE